VLQVVLGDDVLVLGELDGLVAELGQLSGPLLFEDYVAYREVFERHAVQDRSILLVQVANGTRLLIVCHLRRYIALADRCRRRLGCKHAENTLRDDIRALSAHYLHSEGILIDYSVISDPVEYGLKQFLVALREARVWPPYINLPFEFRRCRIRDRNVELFKPLYQPRRSSRSA